MAQTSTATKFTTVRSLLNALARTMNLINPEMENHHQQTAYLAYQTGAEMGLGTEDLHMIVVASLLHDLGTIVKPQKENLSQIESRRREVAHIGAEMMSARWMHPATSMYCSMLTCVLPWIVSSVTRGSFVTANLTLSR